MSLISCDKLSIISPNKWNALLNAVETSIIDHEDQKDVIILSSTTAPTEIKHILTDYLIGNNNEYTIFSCDIIIEFLISTPKAIQQRMPQISPAIYHNLLNINALSIIHRPTGDIFNLPRNIADFSEEEEPETQGADSGDEGKDEREELHFGEDSDTLNIEFMNYPKYFNIIRECVYENMRSILFKNNVKLVDADWSKRSEFYGILEIGYRCYDGKIVPADVIIQKEDKIFIHCGNYMQNDSQNKFGWIDVPNDRITPPVKRKSPFNKNVIRSRAAAGNVVSFDIRAPHIDPTINVNNWVFNNGSPQNAVRAFSQFNA